LSLHVSRLLIEARGKGFKVEGVMFEQMLNFLRSIAGKNEIDLRSARERAYAIYLLTRENIVTTSYLDTLKEGLVKYAENKEWKEDVTALFMASSYAMLKLDDEAKSLKKNVKLEKEIVGYDSYFDGLIHTGIVLGLLSRHFPEDAKDISSEVFENISKALEARKYSTLSSSLLILGLADYQKALPVPASVELKVSKSPDAKLFEPITLQPGIISTISLGQSDKFIKLEPSQKESMYYQLTQTGYDRKNPVDASNRLEIFREYLDENGKPLVNVKLGSDVKVRIVARIKEENFDPGQVAIVDLYPSGFEFVSGKGESNNLYSDYVDQREDRTILFGSIGKDARSYTYTLKATTKGKFVIPPIFMEAMYDQSANAISSSGSITVE
jgi:uncharacterized protein YfaS (alpha-2-macroglobulin family)